MIARGADVAANSRDHPDGQAACRERYRNPSCHRIPLGPNLGQVPGWIEQVRNVGEHGGTATEKTGPSSRGPVLITPLSANAQCSPRLRSDYSGNPAFRRPSMYSFAFDCLLRANHADIVKVGSISSTRAAASRASASRPRWAKADAR